ncbi:hypothetical protein AS593_07505 [Caulobacter vibrioides]|nr:hypothetical protein AS593_07505 [Caulobacter vibrioides]
MTTPAIEAVSALSTTELSQIPSPVRSAPSGGVQSFAQMLLNGVQDVNQKLVDADAQVAAFAVDDSIPVHQVTYALEHARLSFELMLQVRNRLVEGYQELMRMQL